MKREAYILAGATATGKTAVAQQLAESMQAAIISADAMLVYSGMDIGTAKPSLATRGDVPYAGIDCVTPDQMFSVGAWLAAISEQLRVLPETMPIIVAGGTGLYIKALTHGLDCAPTDATRRAHWEAVYARDGLVALHAALAACHATPPPGDIENPRRLIRALELIDITGALPAGMMTARTTSARFTVLRLPRHALHARIATRAKTMFANGLVDETAALRVAYPVWSETARCAIGYREALDVLDGTCSATQALERVVVRTRQLAKRQETWFRHQAEPRWIDVALEDSVEVIATRVAKDWSDHGPETIIIP